MSSEPGRFLKWLLGFNPRQGRLLTEDGGWINQADLLESASVFDISNAVARGDAHRFFDVREGVSTGDVFYYSFTGSPTRHTILYTFDLDVTEGPIQIDNVIGATYTPGTPLESNNLFFGGGPAELTGTKGATDVVGGVIQPNTYIIQGPNNVIQSDASRAGAFTVFPPAAELLVKVTANVSPSCDIKLALIFAEVDIPDGIAAMMGG